MDRNRRCILRVCVIRDAYRSTGSYYTPDEVVSCTVRLVDEALQSFLGQPLGVASDTVTIIDPAVGTGTYLIRVLETIADSIEQDSGEEFVGEKLVEAAKRIIGFEIQTGPFAVAQMRMAATFQAHGTALDDGQLRLYVSDTLDNPFVEQVSLGSYYDEIAQSRKAANKVKAEDRVVVVLGNPPWRANAKGHGGWIENGDDNDDAPALLEAFLPPEGWGVPGNQTKDLRNLYVYFWRWALWKAFEAHDDSPHGVVAFITSSGWLTGDGLVGMRHHVKGLCDRLYVLDLGGQGRGARKEDNVFAIKTPVAIVIAIRDGSRAHDEPLDIQYRRIRGSRAAKLDALTATPKSGGTAIRLDGPGWDSIATSDPTPIAAASTPAFQRHPALTDLLPWGSRGVEPSRTWVYAPSADLLRQRWDTLVSADAKAKAKLFRETLHAQIDKDYQPIHGHKHSGKLQDETSLCPEPVRVTYRSFDRQWLIPDARLLHSPSPYLWGCHGPDQVYVSHNHKDSLGRGPAVTFGSHITDQGHFNARNDVTTPMWRHPADGVANVAPGLLPLLTQKYGHQVTIGDLYAYIAALLAHPGYTTRFWHELELPGLRVPLTADAGLWHEACGVGSEIIWAHTFGDHYANPKLGRPHGHVRMASGGPKLTAKIPDTTAEMPNHISYDPSKETLHVGETGRIAPVPQAVWDYTVSDMEVLQKWFSYRKRDPAGLNRSALDDIQADRWTTSMTTELLDLLHVLGRTVSLEELQDELLERVLEGPLIAADDLTAATVLPVPASARKAPPVPKADGQQATLDIG